MLEKQGYLDVRCVRFEYSAHSLCHFPSTDEVANVIQDILNGELQVLTLLLRE
ncbi:MAG: hypothetical protein R3C03_17035 [Pirellulaceae bacterium]